MVVAIYVVVGRWQGGPVESVVCMNSRNHHSPVNTSGRGHGWSGPYGADTSFSRHLLSVRLLSAFYVSDTSRRGNSKGLSCPPEIMLLLNGRTGFKTQWTFNPKFEFSPFALISYMSSSHHMVLSTFYRMMTSDLCLQFRPVSWSLDFSSQPPPYCLLWDVWEAFQT